jgi:hypothetical protein
VVIGVWNLLINLSLGYLGLRVCKHLLESAEIDKPAAAGTFGSKN